MKNERGDRLDYSQIDLYSLSMAPKQHRQGLLTFLKEIVQQDFLNGLDGAANTFDGIS
jgi:hypothetical protein